LITDAELPEYLKKWKGSLDYDTENPFNSLTLGPGLRPLVIKTEESIFSISYEGEAIRYKLGYISGLFQTEVLLKSTVSKWYIRKKTTDKHRRDFEMFLRSIKVRVETFPLQQKAMVLKHKTGLKRLDKGIEIIRYSKVTQQQCEEIKSFILDHKRVAHTYLLSKINEWVRFQGRGGHLFDLELKEWYIFPPVMFYFAVLLVKRRYIQSHAYPIDTPEQAKADVEGIDRLLPALIEFLKKNTEMKIPDAI
jgi:hypothetical protein